MTLSSVEYGVFPEIEALNGNFRPGSTKLRFLLDTSLENTLLGERKGLDLSCFQQFFSLSSHQCGCGLVREGRQHDFASSASIVNLKDDIDIAHYMEHLILDLESQLGASDQVSGITLKLDGKTDEFLTIVECDDVHLGIFSINFVLAMMHQALYFGEVDPRYGTVISLAKLLRGRGNSSVDLDEISRTLNIDGALAQFALNSLNAFQFLPTRLLPASKPSREDLGPILIIEDDDQFRKTLNDQLCDRGYHTMTASDGRTALKLLCEYKTGIVLLDVHLPDIDGISIAKWILEAQPSTVIILMSGMIEIGDNPSYTTDAITFIPKPFTIPHLENVLASAHS